MNIAFIIIYVIAVTLQLCTAFPFIISSMANIPKRVIKYQSGISRSLQPLRQYKTTNTLLGSVPLQQSLPTLLRNKWEGVTLPEQKQLKSGRASDLHPIYVVPPQNFQPIVYPISRADGVQAGAKIIGNKELTLTLPPTRTYPYPYPHGFSSWVLGGMSGAQRGSFWEQLSSDQALHSLTPANQQNQILVYVKHGIPGQSPQMPIFEAHGVVASGVNTGAVDQNQLPGRRVIKTKQPVGLSSFFLGGMRGVSGRHWQMPATLVEQIEFMPNDDGQPMTEAEKKRVEYKPAVQFDDESELYNIIKLD